MAQTKIPWCDEVWNPVTGCTPVSAGCAHCYAKRMATRLAGRYGYPEDDPFRVTVHGNRIGKPWSPWHRPGKLIFTCSMGDLFHPDVSDHVLDLIFAVMGGSAHTFLVLTKRPERMAEYWSGILSERPTVRHRTRRDDLYEAFQEVPGWSWNEFRDIPMPPYDNIWMGVSVEDQRTADERIPQLVNGWDGHRFVSCEPMLGPVVINLVRRTTLGLGINNHIHCYPSWEERLVDWVICGGETGPGARPMDPEWARRLRNECASTGVPFFFKEMSSRGPIPDDLQVREWPKGLERR